MIDCWMAYMSLIWTISSLNVSKKHLFSATQLPLSAHFALQLPYTLFGLGRSPNFVDKVEVGIPQSTGKVCSYVQSATVHKYIHTNAHLLTRLQLLTNSIDEVVKLISVHFQVDRIHSWPSLIPNSQVIVIPFPPDKPHE